MSDHATTNDSTSGEHAPTSVDKGKGRAVEEHPDAMEEDESESEESGAEEPHDEVEEEDEDNMEEIDTDNIIADGRRTRGKQIDYNNVSQDVPEDEDEEDDEDFEEPEDHDMKD